MCDNIVEILKKEIIFFFSSIGIDIKSVRNWHSLFFFDFDNPSCTAMWYPEENKISITIHDSILFREISDQEEHLDFTFDCELPSGKKLQPIGYTISNNCGVFQLVFLSDSWKPSSPFLYKYKTYYLDYFDNCIERKNEINPKRGDILIHTIERIKKGDKRDFLPQFTSMIETNQLVSNLQFKSKVPEIQAWIEQQVA